MISWEYLLVSLADAEQLEPEAGDSTEFTSLNEKGVKGWEAVGITTLGHGESAVLMKRPLPEGRKSGGRL